MDDDFDDDSGDILNNIDASDVKRTIAGSPSNDLHNSIHPFGNTYNVAMDQLEIMGRLEGLTKMYPDKFLQLETFTNYDRQLNNLKTLLVNQNTRFIYVNGPPNSGKTELVKRLIQTEFTQVLRRFSNVIWLSETELKNNGDIDKNFADNILNGGKSIGTFRLASMKDTNIIPEATLLLEFASLLVIVDDATFETSSRLSNFLKEGSYSRFIFISRDGNDGGNGIKQPYYEIVLNGLDEEKGIELLSKFIEQDRIFAEKKNASQLIDLFHGSPFAISILGKALKYYELLTFQDCLDVVTQSTDDNKFDTFFKFLYDDLPESQRGLLQILESITIPTIQIRNLTRYVNLDNNQNEQRTSFFNDLSNLRTLGLIEANSERISLNTNVKELISPYTQEDLRDYIEMREVLVHSSLLFDAMDMGNIFREPSLFDQDTERFFLAKYNIDINSATPLAIAALHAILGDYLQSNKELHAADRHYGEAIYIYGEYNMDKEEIARVLYRRAGVSISIGKLESAREFAASGLEFYRESDDREGMLLSYLRLTNINRRLGNYAEGMVNVYNAIAIAEETNHNLTSIAYRNLATIGIKIENYPLAYRALESSLKVAYKLDQPEEILLTKITMANLDILLNQNLGESATTLINAVNESQKFDSETRELIKAVVESFVPNNVISKLALEPLPIAVRSLVSFLKQLHD